jgi:hypothetical protein
MTLFQVNIKLFGTVKAISLKIPTFVGRTILCGEKWNNGKSVE